MGKYSCCRPHTTRLWKISFVYTASRQRNHALVKYMIVILSGTVQMLKSIELVRSPNNCFHGSYRRAWASRQNPDESTRTQAVSIHVSCLFFYIVTASLENDFGHSNFKRADHDVNFPRSELTLSRMKTLSQSFHVLPSTDINSSSSSPSAFVHMTRHASGCGILIAAGPYKGTRSVHSSFINQAWTCFCEIG